MSPTVKTLARLLDEYFVTGFLEPRDRAKYQMISRYRDQVSQRLLDEQKAMYDKAKPIHDQWFREQLMKDRSETVFGLLAKDDHWIGGYVTVPIRYPR
jgi:hypothetical protein